MGYKLTPIERETIIVFNEQEPEAVVSTCNSKFIKLLDKYTALYDDYIRVNQDEYGSEYKVPKTYISIRKPPQYTPKQREEMANRARALKANK